MECRSHAAFVRCKAFESCVARFGCFAAGHGQSISPLGTAFGGHGYAERIGTDVQRFHTRP